MELKTCEHCGEGEYIVKVAKYWHRLTPGLVRTLVKVYKRVCEKSENIVYMSELDLNHSEYGNFQKLRFHALIAKYKKDGVVVHRAWVITKRGASFLRGELAVPTRVQTILNRVVAHDTELVLLRIVMRQEEDWQTYEDFASQITMVEFSDPEVDIDKLKGKTTKKRKGKKYCPKDETKMLIGFRIEPGKGVVRYYKCTVCGAEEIII